MTVFVRDGESKMDVLQTYFALMRGEQQALPGVHLWSTSQTLKIRTKPKAAVAVDGNAFGTTPLRMHVEQRALRVMMPPNGTAGSS
jgi:diacylglycerol kinase family enzyme